MAKGARHDLKGKGKARERSYGKARDRTRGDRPRLIEDPELEEKVLTRQLQDAGLYAANILGDGNCLFRALSDQLYGSPSMHHAIRQEICDYLAAHPDKYRLFVDEDSVKGGFEGHVREMRQNGTYGTNIELSAFVARYRRPVKVFQPNLVYVLPVEDQGPSASASSSSSPPPPPPPPVASRGTPSDGDEKLTPREKRLRARQAKLDAKGKGKAKERSAASAQTESSAPSEAASASTEPYDSSPLCIVYHSWEHYSSLRNISGPHTGPPRLRVARVNSPAANEGLAAGNAGTPGEGDRGDDQGRDADEADDVDIDMVESRDSTPPERRSSRKSSGDHYQDDQQVPAQRGIPVFPPSDSSLSPSSPPSPPASSPGASDSARPPKHLLDRSYLSRPRSHSPLSISSSSSSAPATAGVHPTDDDPELLDANDNDRVGPRVRSRLTSPATSTNSSSSGTSTGVASSFAAGEADSISSLSTRGSSRGPSDGPATSPHPASTGPGRPNASKPQAETAASDRSPASTPPSSPPPTTAPEKVTPRVSAAELTKQRERRGPTASEKKEAARLRRMERRKAKGLEAVPHAGGARGSSERKLDAGRVLRSGKRTGDGGGTGTGAGDAGLGKVRELYI